MSPSKSNELTEHELGFIDYLVSAWGEFDHSYVPPRNKVRWECKSLADAAKKYVWRKACSENNRKLLNALAEKLINCLDNHQESGCHELHHVCLEILEWGGVEGVSSAWLRVSCAEGTLRKKIHEAVELLKEGTIHQDWKRFNGKDLVMNSGLTKIYALADRNNIPIYDGRVGAGLGLLVRKHLEEQKSNLNEVPAELAFRWGAGQTAPKKGIQHSRDPSNEVYQFKMLRSSEQDHENCCWRAGRIMREVVSKLNSSPPSSGVDLLDLGDALFMIGRIVHSP